MLNDAKNTDINVNRTMPAKKFIILAATRSGSTYLKDLLDSHPRIRAWGEIFLRKSVMPGTFAHYCKSSPPHSALYSLLGGRFASRVPYNFGMMWLHKRFLDWFYSFGDSSDEQAAGFKLMYGDVNAYQKRWIRKEGVSVIHLIRENALKRHLSILTSQKRRFAHSTKQVKPIKVYCNPNTIAEDLKRYMVTQDRMRKTFLSNPTIEVHYEDFLYSYPEPYDKVLDFLGVERWQAPPAKLRKLNPDSAEDIIENYEEIVDALADTPYERFLK